MCMIHPYLRLLILEGGAGQSRFHERLLSTTILSCYSIGIVEWCWIILIQSFKWRLTQTPAAVRMFTSLRHNSWSVDHVLLAFYLKCFVVAATQELLGRLTLLHQVLTQWYYSKITAKCPPNSNLLRFQLKFSLSCLLRYGAETICIIARYVMG